MLKFTLPAKVVMAADLYKAVNDVRYYLNGICIESQHVIGTDGHTLYFSELTEPTGIEGNLIIKIVGKIPTKAWTMDFEFDESMKFGRAICKTGLLETVGIVYFEVVDGKYPDWRRIIKRDDQQAVTQIGINCKYLDRLMKCVKLVGNPKYMGAVMNLYGADRSMIFDINGPEFKSTVIIIPMKL